MEGQKRQKAWVIGLPHGVLLGIYSVGRFGFGDVMWTRSEQEMANT
jgi:hypothetical protein